MKPPLRTGLVVIGLAAMTGAVFSPLRHAEFINYDDTKYVTENPTVQKGLTWENVKWAFTTEYFDNWHPVTWLSHMLDCSLFSMNPGAHHLMNVLYHTVNVVLIFLVLRNLTESHWRSAFVAAAFAVHPLRVESVAWIAERKDLLSTLFGLLSIAAYVRYVQKRSWLSYGGALLLFALGLMAKPMIVTLPFLLLLFDYWPLRRFSRHGFGRIVVEKLPFLLLSVLSSIETLHVQYAREIASLDVLSLRIRLLNAIVAYGTYVSKTLWPVDLGVFYPHPGMWPEHRVLAGALLVVGVSAVVLATARKRPYLFVGWFWFVGTLVPVIGIVQVAGQAFADRYTYFSTVGLLVMIVWGVSEAWGNLQRWPALLPCVSLPVLLLGIATTEHQLKFWRDSETLFAHTLAVTEDNVVAHTDYAAALMDQGRYEEALLHYQEAARLAPGAVKSDYNIGFVMAKMNRNRDAITHFREALKNDPTYAPAWTNLGNALLSEGQQEGAFASYREALRVQPANPEAHYSLGNALMSVGQISDAVLHLRSAIRFKPSYVQAHNNLGIALTNLNQLDEASAEYREALHLDPRHVKARYNLASIMARKGRFDQAITEYEEAKRIAEANGQQDFARVIQASIDKCQHSAVSPH